MQAEISGIIWYGNMWIWEHFRVFIGCHFGVCMHQLAWPGWTIQNTSWTRKTTHLGAAVLNHLAALQLRSERFLAKCSIAERKGGMFGMAMCLLNLCWSTSQHSVGIVTAGGKPIYSHTSWESSMPISLGSLLETSSFPLFTRFFCTKPAVFKGLCTSAQKVVFRYCRAFYEVTSENCKLNKLNFCRVLFCIASLSLSTNSK